MWDWYIGEDAGGHLMTLGIASRGEPMTFRGVLDGWRHDADFRGTFSEKLRSIPYRAYFWETPPLLRTTLDMPFECVIVESEALAGARPEPGPFREHFTSTASSTQVVSFESLGRDALLVVPCPRAEPSAYVHLAAFLRLAPTAQVHDLWRLLSEAIEGRLTTAPIWLSTAGLGVHWLHVRLDSRPKYYRHRPYTNPAYRRAGT